MIFKYLKQTLSVLFLLPVLFFSTEVKSQCDVFIEPGSVNVIDNGSGVKFEFQITNNSGVDWYGDDLKLFWSLNSSVPIWNIDYTDNTASPPIADGETRTIKTPWFDFPNLPSWFPEDPGPGGALDDNWVEAYEWPYWSVTPTGFDGTWSQFNLRLGSCGLGDGAWVYNSDGTPYYGPFDSECPDVNEDALCDCDVDFIGFDPVTYDASISIISHWNCGQPLNNGTQSSEMDYINMLQIGVHVPGWDYNWGCLDGQYHEGWTYDNPVSFTEYYAGDTINYNLFSDESSYDDCFQEMLESDTLTSCLEVVLWQINYSNTAIVGEIDGGWASTCGTCNNQTQMYPDISMNLNSLNVCESPPPLYPGCIDPEAENYDETADFDDGSCAYPPIFGCQDPTACNYNSEATQNDGSCITCSTPYEEGLACNEYQNTEGYWDWYLSIFNCNPGCTDQSASNYDPEAENDDGSCEYLSPDAGGKVNTVNTLCVDGELSNLVNIVVSNFNTGGFNATDTLFNYCVEVPELGLDSCLNGYENGGSWIEPGGGQMIWPNVYIPDTIPQITVNVYYAEDEIEEYSFNNTFIYQNLFQDPDVCIILGCTDPEATNYNFEATEDDGSCDYFIDLSIDSLSINEFCDEFTPYWVPTIHLSNLSNQTIDEYCIKVQVLGQTNDTLCFSGTDYSLPPFGTLSFDWPNPIYSYGTISIHVLDVNGENPSPLIGYGFDDNLSNNTLVVGLSSFTINCDVLGCTDDTANNYNPDANVDNGSCTYDITELTYVGAECFVDCDVDGPYWYVVTTWTNTGNVEITDFCSEWDVTGGQGDDIMCFNGSLLPGDTTSLQYGPYNVDVGLIAWAYVTEINGVTFNPPLENYETLYCFGEAQASCVYGCMDVTANNYNPDADFDDGSCTYDVLGCTDNTANNYNPDANVDDGSCTYDVLGCTDPDAENYNPDADIDDGSCQIGGCTIEQACNYNPDATYNDGSCDFESCVGCTDPEAINYDPVATEDDGSCIYPIYGCTDPEAFNYDPLANTDDGSCIDVVIGCMIPEAINYNPLANIQCTPIDECCIFPEGCTDPEANNYDPNAIIDDGSCTYDVLGCTDPEANNYNPNANVDDGSCLYDVFGCTDPLALNYNINANIDDGTCLYPGPCDSFEGDAFAPNAFSPNNDGLNDSWRILTESECWNKWSVIIYNRWGQVVYEMTSPDEVWDGSFRDGDYYVQDGVYAYRIEAVSWNLKTIQETGFITVLR
jgi:gliding motility-associated-like protein